MGGLRNISSCGLKEVLSIQMKGKIMNKAIRVNRLYTAIWVARDRKFVILSSVLPKAKDLMGLLPSVLASEVSILQEGKHENEREVSVGRG